MLAAHLDNLLFLLFIAIAIFFQILTRAASKGRRRPGDTRRISTPPSQMSRPLSGDADETDEQRIRKFLEALGQPTTSKPPAPVAPRTDIPPRPVAPVQPPVVIPRAWGLSREQQTKRDISKREISPPEQPRHVEFVRPKVLAPVAPAFEVHEG